ncbi:MAG: exodeoxyribonuclease VII large subunit [bacterium]
MQIVPLAGEEVLTISRLTQQIRKCLEGSFELLWIEGEISNFRVPSSGHFYFTLKDELAQIRAVMFRMRNSALRFIPEDGLQVICRAELAVYPPKGEYQLVIQWMEPKGQGALQLAFEALKRKLADEGLFDASRKRPIPYLPRSVGLVTSPTGAAIRDFLKILWGRFPNMEVRFCPVRVQGEWAREEIAGAIQMLNEEGRAEVLVVARGGGCLEDLWAFNEEKVARAIASSAIPVISAVGHEIDFTIADFVADLRAPTPSAAAELVVPEKAALSECLASLRDRLLKAEAKDVRRRRETLSHLARRLVHPGRRLREHLQRLDELEERLRSATARALNQAAGRLAGWRARLIANSPSRKVRDGRLQTAALRRDLVRLTLHRMDAGRQACRELAGRLQSLSPLAVLSRGYSITRLVPDGRVLKGVEGVGEGSRVEVTLARGKLACSVRSVEPGERATADKLKGER